MFGIGNNFYVNERRGREGKGRGRGSREVKEREEILNGNYL